MEGFSLNTSLLTCPTCSEAPLASHDGRGGTSPCPCEEPRCPSQQCHEVYQMCSALFGCSASPQDSLHVVINVSAPHLLPTNTSPDYDWYFLVFPLLLMTAGAVGNILVCLAVCLDRSLQNSTNYFLLSLALADLLVSLIVMPLGAIPGFLGYWPLGLAWCSVYVTSDVLACSASILHMCVISLGRYRGIRNPLGARHRRSMRFLAKKVVGTWGLAALISSPITILAAQDPLNIMPSPGLCSINNRAFSLFGSVFAFYAPMMLMVGSYALTLHLLRRKARFGAAARAQRLMRTRQQQQATQNTRLANGGAAGITTRSGQGQGTTRDPRSLRLRSVSVPAHLRLSEHKASTVLGLVFASFVLCWAPFFVLNVLVAVCPRCAPSHRLVSVCLWLGYGSSTINPIIYTAFNRTFRAALLRLLRCRGAPPPPRFRSVTECRTIAGSSGVSAAIATASVVVPPCTPSCTAINSADYNVPSAPSTINFPSTFDIMQE